MGLSVVAHTTQSSRKAKHESYSIDPASTKGDGGDSFQLLWLWW